MNDAPSRFTLDQSDNFQPCRVAEVRAPEGCPEWREWLQEIGFLPGERVMLMARAQPGGDPLVVRVGGSTFALRVAEARCVSVEALQGAAAQ